MEPMMTRAQVMTAEMIRCVTWLKWYGSLFCQVCGEPVQHVTESGDQLCSACLIVRRNAWREKMRPFEMARAEKLAQEKLALARKRERALRNFEGDRASVDLARAGYYDEFYGEYVGSETVGPQPRWITSTHRASEVRVSPNSLARAIFCLLAARMLHTIRANALRNARIHLHEMWCVADGHRDVTTMYDGTDDRDMGPDVLSWLQRDGKMSQRQILNRWARPDDEQDFMDELREQGRESEWWELMVDFRRRKLDGLLKEYFGLDDYRASMIVLKWEKGASGRWRPAKQMNVVDWVKWSCEESGSILGGLQSCTRSIQTKTQLRKRKETRNALVAETAEDTEGTFAWM